MLLAVTREVDERETHHFSNYRRCAKGKRGRCKVTSLILGVIAINSCYVK